MSPDDLVGIAIDAAEAGLAAGEIPIGAVVALGDTVLARAHTEERNQGRRLVHAELLAMIEADRSLGWHPRDEPVVLATTLEPCLMCLGAAMALGVDRVFFGLESPSDGAAAIVASWPAPREDMPFYRPPVIMGGIRRSECQDQFVRFHSRAPDSGMRRWAQTLAELP